jgi:exodeoxyribonuclease X
MLIRVLDTETTGIEPTDHVVEIAAWDLFLSEKSSASPLFIRVGERLVKPPVPIPAVASAVHHIIDEDVAEAEPWDRVYPGFVGEHDGKVIDAYAAHNAKFDRQWLNDEMCGGKPFICTYRCALRVWPDAPSHSNNALRYWLKPEQLDRSFAREAHRAGADAYVTAHLLYLLLQKASLQHLIKWSGEPGVLPRVTFGKHRGAAWSDVPLDYLQWTLKQADMNEDVKFTAQREIARRREGPRL